MIVFSFRIIINNKISLNEHGGRFLKVTFYLGARKRNLQRRAEAKSKVQEKEDPEANFKGR